MNVVYIHPKQGRMEPLKFHVLKLYSGIVVVVVASFGFLFLFLAFMESPLALVFFTWGSARAHQFHSLSQNQSTVAKCSPTSCA